MPKGICVNCGKSVGGLKAGYVCNTQGCPNMGKLYCYNCVAKHGGIRKQAVCSHCGRLMQQ